MPLICIRKSGNTGKLPEYKLQYATTLSNMVLPYLKTGEKEKSEDVLDKSLKLIENTVGKEHGLYSASLNNMAIQYYNEGEFEKALKYFEESAEICKKSLEKIAETIRVYYRI